MLNHLIQFSLKNRALVIAAALYQRDCHQMIQNREIRVLEKGYSLGPRIVNGSSAPSKIRSISRDHR